MSLWIYLTVALVAILAIVSFVIIESRNEALRKYK